MTIHEAQAAMAGVLARAPAWVATYVRPLLEEVFTAWQAALDLDDLDGAAAEEAFIARRLKDWANCRWEALPWEDHFPGHDGGQKGAQLAHGKATANPWAEQLRREGFEQITGKAMESGIAHCVNVCSRGVVAHIPTEVLTLKKATERAQPAATA